MTSDAITAPEVLDTLKNNRDETSLYRIYRKLALEHGRCLSLEISDLLYYDKAAVNVKAVFVGGTGAGKSMAAISTCEAVSFWNSLREYDDTRHMQEYFDVDEVHVSIMLKNDIRKMFESANKVHNCYLGDDIGSAWNSRLWAKLYNQILNAYIGTDRTFRTFKCVTLASDKEMDTQARSKFTHYIEMDGPRVFEQGLAFGKLFRIHGKPRINKIFYPRMRGRDHLTGQRQIYQKIAFLAPSDHIFDRYNTLRDLKARLFHQKQFKELDRWEEMIMRGNDTGGDGTRSKKDKILDYADKNPIPGDPKERTAYYQRVAEVVGSENWKSVYQVLKSSPKKK